MYISNLIYSEDTPVAYASESKPIRIFSQMQMLHNRRAGCVMFVTMSQPDYQPQICTSKVNGDDK